MFIPARTWKTPKPNASCSVISTALNSPSPTASASSPANAGKSGTRIASRWGWRRASWSRWNPPVSISSNQAWCGSFVLFPDGALDQANIDEFNRQTDFEYERVRDFIILHYKATERDDTPFWRYCRDMEVPETLQRKIDLFAANGRIFREDEELFGEESWIQVFLGQGIVPRSYDPLVDMKSGPQIVQFMGDIESVIAKCVKVMPSHAAFVEKFCDAR